MSCKAPLSVCSLCIETDTRHNLPPPQGLLREVEAGPWETLARRRVQHFGYKFEYVVCTKGTLNFVVQRGFCPKCVSLEAWFHVIAVYEHS